MKKLLLPLIALATMPSCQRSKESISLFIYTHHAKKAGMDYIIYEEQDGGLWGINITKDSLEVELLKKQIQQKP